MKKHLSLLCMLLWLVSLLGQSQSQGACQFEKSTTTEFFSNLPPRMGPYRRPYEKMPPKDAATRQVDNTPLREGVCKDFLSWGRKIVKPEYFPDDKFVRANLVLYPASKATNNADIAYLAFTRDSVKYMMSQTAGTYGLVVFMAKFPAPADRYDEKDANVPMNEVLKKFINANVIAKLPSRDCLRADSYIETNDTPAYYFKGFLSKQEVCMSFSKACLQEPVAWAMALNEWFVTAEKKERELEPHR